MLDCAKHTGALRSPVWSCEDRQVVSKLILATQKQYFTHIKVRLKKWKYCERFLSFTSESESNILSALITHGVKYFKPLFLVILMIMVYR